MIKNLTIREAGANDAELVASFITKLAMHERLKDELEIDAERLRRDLGANANPRIWGLIAEIDGVAVGSTIYCLVCNTNTTSWVLHVQDVFIDENHRGHGIGEALFKRLARVARERGCRWIQLEVLHWNEDAKAFYEHLGMIPEQEMGKMYLGGEALRKLSQ
jgi:GNAT superfamily N-acetyltransferase